MREKEARVVVKRVKKEKEGENGCNQKPDDSKP